MGGCSNIEHKYISTGLLPVEYQVRKGEKGGSEMKYVAAILIGFCFTTIAQGWNIESLPHEKEFVTPADAFYSSDDGELFVLVGDAIYLDSEVQVFDWDNQVGWWMPDRTILSGELYFAHSCQMFDSPIYGECLLISDSMNHRVILASPDNGKILWRTASAWRLSCNICKQ